MRMLQGKENNKYQAKMNYEERILTNHRGFKVHQVTSQLPPAPRISDLNNEKQQSFHCRASSSSSSPQTSSAASLSRTQRDLLTFLSHIKPRALSPPMACLNQQQIIPISRVLHAVCVQFYTSAPLLYFYILFSLSSSFLIL